jgi:hypothetical protein
MLYSFEAGKSDRIPGSTIPSRAIEGFGVWITESSEGEELQRRDPPPCVLDFVHAWLTFSGSATKYCADDFRVFLTVVILIIELWNDERLDQSLRDEERVFPRNTTRIFDPTSQAADVLDPYYFQFMVV